MSVAKASMLVMSAASVKLPLTGAKLAKVITAAALSVESSGCGQVIVS